MSNDKKDMIDIIDQAAAIMTKAEQEVAAALSAPREFWVSGIDFDTYGIQMGDTVTAFINNINESKPRRESIHVIEKSAYIKSQSDLGDMINECNELTLANDSLTARVKKLEDENSRLNAIIIVSESATGVMHQATRIKKLEYALNKIIEAERMGYGISMTYGEVAAKALKDESEV